MIMITMIILWIISTVTWHFSDLIPEVDFSKKKYVYLLLTSSGQVKYETGLVPTISEWNSQFLFIVVY